MTVKLDFIIALVRQQHLGRTAETCNVNQPVLSVGIKQLKNTFGVLPMPRG